MNDPEVVRRRNGRILITLLLMPVAMLLASGGIYLMARHDITLFGEPHSQGDLIRPPQPIAHLALTGADGRPVAWAADYPARWTFLVLSPRDCDDDCRQRLWEARQTRLAMGKFTRYLSYGLAVPASSLTDATRAWLAEEHPDSRLVHWAPVRWQALLGQLKPALTSPDDIKFVVVDPRGFLMMRYRDTHTHKQVMRDMKFLIKHN